MNVRRALFIAALLMPGLAGPAAAQFPAPQARQEPPCIKEFVKLRADTEHKGKAIQAASKRKATPQQACGLFKAFVAAEAKMVKYAIDNAAWCGIPPQALEQMKKGHAKATEMRTKICRIAAAPPPPEGADLE